MTREEAKSCINTIEMLRRFALNIHGVIDIIDDENVNKVIAMLQEPERKHGYWFKGEQLFPVCPNCGAIMDGEESNDTKSKEKETD